MPFNNTVVAANMDLATGVVSSVTPLMLCPITRNIGFVYHVARVESGILSIIDGNNCTDGNGQSLPPQAFGQFNLNGSFKWMAPFTTSANSPQSGPAGLVPDNCGGFSVFGTYGAGVFPKKASQNMTFLPSEWSDGHTEGTKETIRGSVTWDPSQQNGFLAYYNISTGLRDYAFTTGTDANVAPSQLVTYCDTNDVFMLGVSAPGATMAGTSLPCTAQPCTFLVHLGIVDS